MSLQRKPFLNHARIKIGVVVLLELGYTIMTMHSYIGHHYVLQNVLILKTFQVTYKMEYSSPFVGDPAPTLNRNMTTVSADRHTLKVVMLSPQSVN
jgi:hypothetical protein